MSIRRTTAIHCDDCGEWEYCGNGETTTSRRKRGWKVWRVNASHHRTSVGLIRHRCPSCVKDKG